MTTPPPLELRVITFPEDGSTTDSATANQVVCALKEHGCFMATYRKLESNQRNIIKASEKIFDRLLPSSHIVADFTYRKKVIHESFDIPEATERGTQGFITRMWPEGKDHDIRNNILAYTRTAETLAEMVRTIVFKHYTITTGYKFRMMKYTEVEFGCSDRTHRKFLAVLDLKQVDGLEMQYNGQWFKIDVKPSTFLIMAGTPLENWGNRVKMHGNEERYSVGLFSYYDKGKNEVPKQEAESSSALVKKMSQLNIGRSKSKGKKNP